MSLIKVVNLVVIEIVRAIVISSADFHLCITSEQVGCGQLSKGVAFISVSI